MRSSSLPARLPVGRVGISRTTYAEAVDVLLDAAAAKRPLLASATSAHGIVLAAREEHFAATLNRFDLLTPDGQPVRWAVNLLHGAGLRDRVYGPTLMRRLLAACASQRLSVYFYGGRPEVLQALLVQVWASLPHLRVAGCSAPPFRALTSDEDAQETERIVASGAHIVFVGLGCPAQERWADAHRAAIGRPLVCVGAAFDFLSGARLQAPPWMQARGLEWLFRVLTEPKRLWRRYAVAVPLFALLVARQYLSQRLSQLLPTGGLVSR